MKRILLAYIVFGMSSVSAASEGFVVTSSSLSRQVGQCIRTRATDNRLFTALFWYACQSESQAHELVDAFISYERQHGDGTDEGDDPSCCNWLLRCLCGSSRVKLA